MVSSALTAIGGPESFTSSLRKALGGPESFKSSLRKALWGLESFKSSPRKALGGPESFKSSPRKALGGPESFTSSPRKALVHFTQLPVRRYRQILCDIPPFMFTDLPGWIEETCLNWLSQRHNAGAA
ncbi:hypothetical protein PoB_001634000 [Plakobranchus ocellatus]|uniref:Uncharacterized protein n=1 Tax=Plakobranchus ocellatus TaxID=259542 RepID=A0AAV3Z3V4_9GAST|nr:hypothetical protein PoB_001634000 [Plakobranchus ocellatus]